MDSNSRESLDSKAEFRKPANDAANRKYRRRSPVGGSSSSSDGSPHRECSSSPVPSKKDTVRKDDAKSQSGRSGESYKHSDRQSSRSYHRHDDHSRRDRHGDEYDRYSRSSYRSGRDSRDSNSLDHSRGDKEHRSRDRDRHREDRGDRYGKSDLRKSSRDYKGDYEESRGQRNDSSSRRDSSGHRKEGSLRDAKEQGNSESKEHSDDKSVKIQDSVAKKPKLFSPDSAGAAQDGTSEQTCVKDSDIDAAKIAAMKAAELVNKNLVGTGYMSTDQKKKLLWGNKKNTATEESAHRWDASMFGDRERQEKFNKLMSLNLHWCLWPIVGRQGRNKGGEQARQSRDGEASDGSGEAIYSRVAPERRSNCWTWALKYLSRYFDDSFSVLFWILLCWVGNISCKTVTVRLGISSCFVRLLDTLLVLFVQ